MKTRKRVKIRMLLCNAEFGLMSIAIVVFAMLFVQGCFKQSLGECVIGGAGAIGLVFCLAEEINNRLNNN